MKHFFFSILFILFGLAMVTTPGCDVINPEEEVPSYIYIDTFHLSTNLGNEGFASHKITDAWVIVNDLIIGTFELPAFFPVLDAGESDVIIQAGIKDNGISATRVAYPAYEAFQTTIDLERNQVDTLVPSIGYLGVVNFTFIERFETGNEFSTTSANEASMTAVVDPDIVFEGNRCIGVSMTDGSEYFEAKSNTHSLPRNGTPVYVEIDFMGNNPMDVWLIASVSSATIEAYLLTVAPQDDWNKIYVNLTNTLTSLSGATDFEIMFTARKSNDVDVGEIYMDNIKLLHL